MADYAIVGFKGAGKGLHAVSRIQDAVNSGRRVATNLDIFTEHLCSDSNNKNSILRLPDYPRFEDFSSIGYGYDKRDGEKIDESKFGVIVLDEISIWMNARNWNDKSRLSSISWLRQARKFRWHVYYLAQSPDSVDNQTRELFEHIVNCQRTDRAFYPFFGRFLNVFNDCWGRLPKVHRATVSYRGVNAAVDTWVLQGVLLKSIYQSYDTEQVFVPDELVTDSGRVIDMRASYSILPAYYINKWYSQPQEQDSQPSSQAKYSFFKKLLFGFFLVFCLFYFFYFPLSSDSVVENHTPVVNAVPEFLNGVYISGTVKKISDGHINYFYALNSSEHKPIYPEDYGYHVIPLSICSARITSAEFSQSITCGGRYVPEYKEPSNLSNSLPTDIFDVKALNPLDN